MQRRSRPTMTSDEFDESFRLWLASSRARAHRISRVRWFAQDLAAGVVWLNESDPKVTEARGQAIKAYFLDPLGYRFDALVWRGGKKLGGTRAQIRRALQAAR